MALPLQKPLLHLSALYCYLGVGRATSIQRNGVCVGGEIHCRLTAGWLGADVAHFERRNATIQTRLQYTELLLLLEGERDL